MGDVVALPSSPEMEQARITEARFLRNMINGGKPRAPKKEIREVAIKVNDFIDRFAGRNQESITSFCAKIWKTKENPAGRRDALKKAARPKTLLDYINKIAGAAGVSKNDLLLEAFRDTTLSALVQKQLRGDEAVANEPDLERFWAMLAETLQDLATNITRTEKLDAHLERLDALHGTYDLSTDDIRHSEGPLLRSPLANWNEHYSEYPPIPSVVLFTEPKAPTVERTMTLRGTGRTIPVRMTVLREVRLAIGPADDVLVPAPLFEFRSVLSLVGPEGAIRIRCPWLYLDEDEVEVDAAGHWETADLPFDGGDPDAMPEGYAAGSEIDDAATRELYRAGGWKFPARLETPLQFEHVYIAWRPVTAATCRDLLLRNRHAVSLGTFKMPSEHHGPSTYCPPGTLAEAVELALHEVSQDGLPKQLRAQAQRMTRKVQAWHLAREAGAEAAHAALRKTWESWT